MKHAEKKGSCESCRSHMSLEHANSSFSTPGGCWDVVFLQDIHPQIYHDMDQSSQVNATVCMSLDVLKKINKTPRARYHDKVR